MLAASNSIKTSSLNYPLTIRLSGVENLTDSHYSPNFVALAPSEHHLIPLKLTRSVNLRSSSSTSPLIDGTVFFVIRIFLSGRCSVSDYSQSISSIPVYLRIRLSEAGPVPGFDNFVICPVSYSDMCRDAFVLLEVYERLDECTSTVSRFETDSVGSSCNLRRLGVSRIDVFGVDESLQAVGSRIVRIWREEERKRANRSVFQCFCDDWEGTRVDAVTQMTLAREKQTLGFREDDPTNFAWLDRKIWRDESLESSHDITTNELPIAAQCTVEFPSLALILEGARSPKTSVGNAQIRDVLYGSSANEEVEKDETSEDVDSSELSSQSSGDPAIRFDLRPRLPCIVGPDCDAGAMLDPPIQQARSENLLLRDLLEKGDDYLRTLVPERAESEKLNEILRYFVCDSISQEDQKLLVQYMYWLQGTKKDERAAALVMSVLREPVMKNEVLRDRIRRYLQDWDNLSIPTALVFLSHLYVSLPFVRDYAVLQILRPISSTHEGPREIQSVLMQLVQALNFEDDVQRSGLGRFLLEMSVSRFEFASELYWHLQVEIDKATVMSSQFDTFREDLIAEIPFQYRNFIMKQALLHGNLNKLWDHHLLDHRIHREERIVSLKILLRAICEPDNPDWQDLFPLYLPLRPDILVVGIDPEKCNIFSSNSQPIMITFIGEDGSLLKTILKKEEDLRKDQLILNIIRMMDEVLKKNALEMHLSPYNCVALTLTEGLIEMVDPSTSLHNVLYKKGLTIRDFLKQKVARREREQAYRNFAISAAAYSVISFVLGLGDRHLDNILIRPSGQMFHIDFGFVFGQQPKGRTAISPAIKMTKDMIEALGTRQQVELFRKLSLQCYDVLTKKSSLFVNMILLMLDSDIPGIASQGDIDLGPRAFAVQQLRQRLGYSSREFEEILEACMYGWASLGGRAVDYWHRFGQHPLSQATQRFLLRGN